MQVCGSVLFLPATVVLCWIEAHHSGAVSFSLFGSWSLTLISLLDLCFIDSFPEGVADMHVNFYGSALELNKDDEEEDLKGKYSLEKFYFY